MTTRAALGDDAKNLGTARPMTKYPGTMLSQPNELLVLNAGLESARRAGTTTAISTGSMTTRVGERSRDW